MDSYPNEFLFYFILSIHEKKKILWKFGKKEELSCQPPCSPSNLHHHHHHQHNRDEYKRRDDFHNDSFHTKKTQ